MRRALYRKFQESSSELLAVPPTTSFSKVVSWGAARHLAHAGHVSLLFLSFFSLPLCHLRKVNLAFALHLHAVSTQLILAGLLLLFPHRLFLPAASRRVVALPETSLVLETRYIPSIALLLPILNARTHPPTYKHTYQKKRSITMLSSLTTKIALRKVGLNSKSFDFSGVGGGSTDSKSSKKGSDAGLDDDAADGNAGGWPAWMSMKSLPITVAPWFSPPPPPVPIGEVPKIGELAPLDRDRQLEFGRGRPVLVVFLRCVGCACTFFLSRCFSPIHFQPLRDIPFRYFLFSKPHRD